jgi:hypothetical protein
VARAQATGDQVTAAEIREIAREAYVYGFPMVDNLRIQHSYCIDKSSPEYKAPYNRLLNIPRVYTPDDKPMQTPNSDTPYSWIGFDLRAEPVVVTVPRIEKGRYWSLQLIDLYTHNFDYLGSRTTGNDGGRFLIAGPSWTAETPKGITKVIRCETDLALGLFRTQLFNPADLENVKQIQAAYAVTPLSAFLGEPAPKAAPAISFPKPLTPAEQKTSLEFYNQLNFGLGLCSQNPGKKELRERFARIGIGPGRTIDFATLSPEHRKAYEAGIADGQKLNGSNRYVLRFPPGRLPPVDAFWSLTMYDQPASLLVANPLNRYLLNSTMLEQFTYDPDGGLTLLVQNESPGQDREANWLPAPKGDFCCYLRLYRPQAEALDGRWTAPKLTRVAVPVTPETYIRAETDRQFGEVVGMAGGVNGCTTSASPRRSTSRTSCGSTATPSTRWGSAIRRRARPLPCRRSPRAATSPSISSTTTTTARS